MKHFMMSVAALSVLSLTACGQADASGKLDRTEVEQIVKAYLLENPEILREAFQALEVKEEKAALDSVRDDIFKDPRDVAIGPKNAKVTIVEFFDYNCGYCKRSTEWVKDVIDEHGDDVRVVFKELPLLDGRTKTSRYAAKVALAAARQGKYSTVHFSLMSERSLTKDRSLKIAEDAGLDMDLLKKDLEDPALERQINDTIVLAQRIPSLTGTPYFLINDEQVSGANTPELQRLLDEALSN
ncbi:MAG: DsbA family protein [Maricaulaceae bacterium]